MRDRRQRLSLASPHLKQIKLVETLFHVGDSYLGEERNPGLNCVRWPGKTSQAVDMAEVSENGKKNQTLNKSFAAYNIGLGTNTRFQIRTESNIASSRCPLQKKRKKKGNFSPAYRLTLHRVNSSAMP